MKKRNAEKVVAHVSKESHEALLSACKEAYLILKTSGLDFERLEKAIALAESR